MRAIEKYQPEKCSCCNQTTTYKLGLDKGSVDILLLILKAISEKGINEIHPSRELDLTGKQKWFLTNLSRPRFHGLIAFVKEKKGYYCLTKKAGKFLRGELIPQYAIISKITGHQDGYWMPEKYQVSLKGITKSDEYDYWDGEVQSMIDYIDPKEVVSGQASLFAFTAKRQSEPSKIYY